MKHKPFYTALVAFALAVVQASSALAATPPTLDDLIVDLAGNDDVKRSLARQFIPRHGTEGLSQLIPLLFHENPAVSWAAKNTILDIANDVSVAGLETERAYVAQSLLDTLAATDNKDHQFTLLRMLPVVVPEGADLSPIATLLYQEGTRERARRALQEMNTSESRAALRGALASADAAFAPALMDALDKTDDLEGVDLVMARFEEGSPEEQAAAAQYLARTGDPDLAAPMLALAKSIDINDRFRAEDATLRLADTLATQGGTWEAAMALYRDMLAQSENPVIKGTALAGMGRYGDETVLADIMEAWAADESGLLEAPAMAAIGFLQDPAVPELLMAAYAEQPQAVQGRLLGIMGRSQDARYLPLFEGADNVPAAVRIDALQQLKLPQAVPILERIASDATAEDSAAAAEAIRAMASAFRDQGDRAGAGRAYLALYRIAPDDEARNAAMEGIKAYPVAEAYDELKAALGEDGLLDLPLQVLTGMARVLGEAGRAEESKLLKTTLLARANDTATVQQLIQLGPAQGTHEEFARQLGFINQWQVAAPFPLAGAPDNGAPVLQDGQVDLSATYGEGDNTVAWKPMGGAGAMAIVNLAGMALDNARAFAYVTVNVPEAQEATLRIGSDDGVRAWVNGERVHNNETDRGVALDNDQVPIKLQAGDNAVLLEIIQHAGGWGFTARLTETDGRPLQFEQK